MRCRPSPAGWWVAAVAVIGVGGCRPASLDLEVAARGHAEVLIADDGAVIPVVVNADLPAGICLRVADGRDTSRWEGVLRFDGRRSPDGFRGPAARLGQTICFDGRIPPSLDASPSIRLCLELVDRFDDTELRPPCTTVAFAPELAPEWQSTSAERNAILRRRSELDSAELVAELDDLATRARAAGLPLMAVNLDLIAVHYLIQDGSPPAIDEARRRLFALPPFVDRLEVGRVGATVALQRADFLKTIDHDYEAAWLQLEAAEERFLRRADATRLFVTMEQASILERMGAGREARERLRNALADCQRLTCHPEILAAGRSDLAWRTVLDPDASESELAAAAQSLAEAEATLPPEEQPFEHATQRVNHAFVDLRMDRDPAPQLALARAALERLEGSEVSSAELRDWARLAEGLYLVETGEPAAAIPRCRRLSAHPNTGLAAWAISCVGRAERSRGALAAADRAFSRALELYEQASWSPAFGEMEISPGRRAQDFARAARVAVERGDAQHAWRLLASLDQMAVHEGERRRCRASATGPARRRWIEIDEQIRTLYRELAATGAPASGARRRSLEPVRAELRRQLRALWREWPGCRSSAAANDAGVRFRAFAVDDEILLLERGAEEVRLARRTAMSRRELHDVVEQVTSAGAEPGLSAEAWRRTFGQLAEALLPPGLETTGEVTTYALHGPLQRVPVAALPLPEAGGPRYLGGLTIVALRPAAASARTDFPQAEHRPLFVVDPRGDLAAAAELASEYRSLFPEATLWVGREATSDRFLQSLPAATFVHLDAHGTQEPGFPELTALRLADRPLSLVELAGQPFPHDFVNLSGCRTGYWPVTADSGRYGLGGLLIRLGVPWVISSAGDLDDRVAADFNRALYRAIRRGAELPGAYREALRLVAAKHPPASWAPILLLQGAPSSRENGNGWTPTENEAAPATSSVPEPDGETR